LIAGNPECRSQRETRFWQIPHRNRICYLAYNRSYALNRPAAIWQTGRSGYINGD